MPKSNSYLYMKLSLSNTYQYLDITLILVLQTSIYVAFRKLLLQTSIYVAFKKNWYFKLVFMWHFNIVFNLLTNKGPKQSLALILIYNEEGSSKKLPIN